MKLAYFTLNGTKPVPIQMTQWAIAFNRAQGNNDWLITRSFRGSTLVETRFDGTCPLKDRKPFSTVVRTSKQMERRVHYATWEEAVQGHRAILAEFEEKGMFLEFITGRVRLFNSKEKVK
jgi:hypothetical protein